VFEDNILCGQSQLLVVPKKEEEPLSFKLYPNPAKDIAVLQFSGELEAEAEIMLADIQGRTILQTRVDQGKQSLLLDTSNLSPGLYFCKVKSTEVYNSMKKLIIIR